MSKKLLLISIVLSVLCLVSCSQKNDYQILSSVSSDSSISNIGSHKMQDTSNIQKEIDTIKDNTRFLGFVMYDLKSHSGISYNANELTTSQSSIKGPYTTATLLEDSNRFYQDKEDYKQTIMVSDNEAYDRIREKYGNEPLEKWGNELEINNDVLTSLYPRNISACDMAKLWVKIYNIFNSNTLPQEFIDYFTGTKFSSIYMQLGSKYKTQTKAGWENGAEEDTYGEVGDVPCDPKYKDGDPKNDEVATNDAGIVYANDKPYILVVFSSIASNPEKLQPLINEIDQYHLSNF